VERLDRKPVGGGDSLQKPELDGRAEVRDKGHRHESHPPLRSRLPNEWVEFVRVTLHYIHARTESEWHRLHCSPF
jgi:hypothetical protein